jgi:hypothetical protein
MPDRIDPVVESVEAPTSPRPLDRAVGVPQPTRQLPGRNDAVLAIRQVGESPMAGWQSLFPHSGHKDCHAPGTPPSDLPETKRAAGPKGRRLSQRLCRSG